MVRLFLLLWVLLTAGEMENQYSAGGTGVSGTLQDSTYLQYSGLSLMDELS